MIHVVLYEPEIPGNTGNIMRTCAGTNTKLHLIEPLGFSLSDNYIKRSGVNYIENCDYKVYDNYEHFLKENQNGEFYFLTRYGKKPHTSFNYNESNSDIYLIFGKESTGIPKEILKNHLDKCMRIPMNDNIRSLNLSNAVAIMLYEVLRQKDYPNLLTKEPFKGEDFLDT
jgi:tRNA (cytidine/uridine-2'-O-)-methyltransferase